MAAGVASCPDDGHSRPSASSQVVSAKLGGQVGWLFPLPLKSGANGATASCSCLCQPASHPHGCWLMLLLMLTVQSSTLSSGPLRPGCGVLRLLQVTFKDATTQGRICLPCLRNMNLVKCMHSMYVHEVPSGPILPERRAASTWGAQEPGMRRSGSTFSCMIGIVNWVWAT